ncbi:twin-arginine translocation signal domain-containing protein [Paractinoplanes atraurantiacus]|uniref:Tat (Twin-arginine translocation) pathway signal sequence n=1 Tax=Paractinoplanes atraurantiacus TaxID=1036182 RepID=A0A285HH13_9ACTN|nr:twin-arginine translocation signal domain-containing protein [Actinoplanes atraurantiacus]SNY35022.1 Tat (twin-arginine translocation) pathway signal sequence [Actinoplanes atraurantiacus]
MGHGHDHDHDHTHESAGGDVAPALDLSIPDSELSPSDVSRRGFLRGAGLLGAGAAASVLAVPSAAQAAGLPHSHGPVGGGADKGGFKWLAGDHHIHTQYSSDAQYRVIDQAGHGRAFGLDWVVITDHGSVAHAKIGVEKVNPDIVKTRETYKDLLTFQGLEWNIPAAEHATVFVTPSRNEVSVLKQFENAYDGNLLPATNTTEQNEAAAIAGIKFLGSQVRARKIDGALFLANHPARRGIDSPHEIRNWRDADPSVAVGFEGAPGHQAAGIPAPNGRGGARGYYDNNPSAASFQGYPLESYRTWGGFDWMTATVGGLWDSLLAEGKAWWITVNSDSHVNYLDQSDRGPDSNFDANGKYNDPVYTGKTLTTAGDFWPGFYGRTNVGATSFGYKAVMDGLRAGRVWVDHGRLIKGLDARVRTAGDRRPSTGTPLGGVHQVKRGTSTELTLEIDLQDVPNWAQFVPVLKRVDVIVGTITGPVKDKDAFQAPDTKVVKSFEISAGAKKVSLSFSLGRLDKPFYVRVRGTDGKRTQPGLLGPSIDPFGPKLDVVGDADPWGDLWFYTNPIFVLPSGR